MEKDARAPTELRVDGGMVVNDWLAQSLADLLQLPVVRPETVETAALGAAFLAGLTAAVYASLDDIASRWRAQTSFEPKMDAARADPLLRGAHEAGTPVRPVRAHKTTDEYASVVRPTQRLSTAVRHA